MGISIAAGAPRINQLFFADDCLLFVKAELEQLKHLRSALKRYEELAGQKINFDKSDITACGNIDEFQLKLLGDF